MDYLKINFEAMRFGPMRPTFDALERTFRKFNIDFYLIGAFARDLWLNHLEVLPERRTTLDVDFCVYIKSQQDFHALKLYLSQEEKFIADDEPYRMHAPDQTIIDLIPFGGIEQGHSVYLDGNPPMELSVFGNLQVLEHAEEIYLNDQTFKVCTLPGLCILKLIASHEKPERLEKDLGDFYYILDNYFEIAADTLYNGNHDDLIDNDFDPHVAAAKVLGRQLLPILKESSALATLFKRILNKLLGRFNAGEIDEMYVYEPNDLQIKRMKLISSLLGEIDGSVESFTGKN
jgi:predicted nucleotidyltransferase